MQRTRADTAGKVARQKFFNMMRNIGHEMQNATAVFTLGADRPQILDTCAAPGGFLRAVLDVNQSADIYAITLPVHLGGHPLLLHIAKSNAFLQTLQIQYLDITTLGVECGLKDEELKPGMSADRPYHDIQCDLVFCDGQLLRTNEQHRDIGLEKYAAARLKLSQLIFAMNRLREEGTMVVLLHKPETEPNLRLLATFSAFSNLKVFKPHKIHATRSSFYMIASNVQSKSAAAQAVVEQWMYQWRQMTLESEGGVDEMGPQSGSFGADLHDVLEQFGSEFIELVEPVWEIQSKAIQKSDWFRAGVGR